MKKKTQAFLLMAAWGFCLSLSPPASAAFRQASPEALAARQHTTLIPPGTELPASQRFTQYEFGDARLNYHLCLPRWYDAGKKYPLIVIINDVFGATDTNMLLHEDYGVRDWADELEKGQKYVIFLTIQYTSATEKIAGPLTGTPGMTLLRELLNDVRQNYGVDTNAVYGIGENKGAWAVQLMEEQQPEFFTKVYLDKDYTDPQTDKHEIHDWISRMLAISSK